MNELDELLEKLGLHQDEHRQAIKGQVVAYGIERALAILLERKELTDADKASLQHALVADHFNNEEFEKVFETPERQKVLQQGMNEAIQVVVDASLPKGFPA